jgi:hypothetical protein
MYIYNQDLPLQINFINSKKLSLKIKAAMGFPVKFSATVTGGYADLDVLIQNELVDSAGGNVNVTENYLTHGNLVARFRISAPGGTPFKIVYACTTGGAAKLDFANPSPVEYAVTNNGFKEIKVTIPI